MLLVFQYNNNTSNSEYKTLYRYVLKYCLQKYSNRYEISIQNSPRFDGIF